MIKSALIAVETALTPIKTLRYINEDWGQLDYYDQPPLLFPCALLECEGVDYTSTGRRMQQARGTIVVRLADMQMRKPGNVTTDTAPRYEFFDIIDQVHKVLQGLSGADFSPLDRRTLRRVRRDDAVREFVMQYSFGYTDAVATPSTHTVNVPPSLDIEIATR